MNAFHTSSILLDVNPSLCTDTQHTMHPVTSISVGKYLANYMTKTSETVHQILHLQLHDHDDHDSKQRKSGGRPKPVFAYTSKILLREML